MFWNTLFSFFLINFRCVKCLNCFYILYGFFPFYSIPAGGPRQFPLSRLPGKARCSNNNWPVGGEALPELWSRLPAVSESITQVIKKGQIRGADTSDGRAALPSDRRLCPTAARCQTSALLANHGGEKQKADREESSDPVWPRQESARFAPWQK